MTLNFIFWLWEKKRLGLELVAEMMMFVSRIKMLTDVHCAELSVELLQPWSFNQNVFKVCGVLFGWFDFGVCGLGILLFSFVFLHFIISAFQISF